MRGSLCGGNNSHWLTGKLGSGGLCCVPPWLALHHPATLPFYASCSWQKPDVLGRGRWPDFLPQCEMIQTCSHKLRPAASQHTGTLVRTCCACCAQRGGMDVRRGRCRLGKLGAWGREKQVDHRCTGSLALHSRRHGSRGPAASSHGSQTQSFLLERHK